MSKVSPIGGSPGPPLRRKRRKRFVAVIHGNRPPDQCERNHLLGAGCPTYAVGETAEPQPHVLGLPVELPLSARSAAARSSTCGDAATHPAILLLGTGIRTFSVACAHLD
jgi:hypothetical protein